MSGRRIVSSFAGLSAPVLVMAMALSGGCGSRRVTDTPRTGSEQLLVAAAVDQAVAQLDFGPLEDRSVFIDDSLVERVDKTFLVATVRARAWTEGVRVVSAVDDADYVLELRSGAVGVNRNEYVFGIPSSEMPSQLGSVPIPEAALYKSVDQSGVGRVSFVVYRRDDRRFFYASGPKFGFSNEKAWWLFGAGPSINENIRPPRDDANTASQPQPLDVSLPPPPEDDPGAEPAAGRD